MLFATDTCNGCGIELHALHARVERPRLLAAVLSSVCRGVLSSNMAPACQWDHDASTVVLRAEVLAEVNDRLGCAGRVNRATCEVDKFLVGQQGGEAIRNENEVGVLGA